jgi:hypothetical protein
MQACFAHLIRNVSGGGYTRMFHTVDTCVSSGGCTSMWHGGFALVMSVVVAI